MLISHFVPPSSSPHHVHIRLRIFNFYWVYNTWQTALNTFQTLLYEVGAIDISILHRRKLRLWAVKHCVPGQQRQYAPSKGQQHDGTQAHLLSSPGLCQHSIKLPLRSPDTLHQIHISWRAAWVHIYRVHNAGCSLGPARGAAVYEVVLCPVHSTTAALALSPAYHLSAPMHLPIQNTSRLRVPRPP